MHYRLEKTSLGEKWDQFVQNSWNGTLFSYSDYLRSIPYQSAVYYCYNSEELRAAVVLIETDDQNSTFIYGPVIHNGIIFGSPTNRQNTAQQHSERFRIAEFIANELPRMYQKVEFRQDPLYQDLRPFLWVHYGCEAPKYQVDIRYTSYLSIKDFCVTSNLEEIETYQKASASRRKEIRYAQRKGVITHEKFDIDLFLDFYIKTMSRQGTEISIQLRKETEEIQELTLNLFKAGLGRMFISYTKDGKAGSIAFFGVDHKRGYYLFGANNPNIRDKHTGTAVLWDSFRLLNQTGVTEIDLEGINSPQRGWFKLSFGGTISPYYHLSYLGKSF